MPITRSFTDDFKTTDWTEQLNRIPNIRTPLSSPDVNLFTPQSVATTTVTFEEIEETIGLMTDVRRGAEVIANKDDSRKVHAYNLPYYKDVDAIATEDILGQRAYGSATEAETLAAAIERKMKRMKRKALMFDEYCKFQAIVNGQIYSPSGAITHTSFWNDFGATRKVLSFELDVATTDVAGKVNEVVAHIQDNLLSGEGYDGTICFCSPEFFSALTNHAKVSAAYTNYSSSQEPLRNRLGGDNIIYQEFFWKGVLFREIRGGVDGNLYVPANEAHFVPLGTSDTFISHWGPSNKLDLAGFLGEEMYMHRRQDLNNEGIKLELEMAHIHLVRRPQCVVKATLT